MLEAISVSKIYLDGVQALVDVDLAVERGETVALIGESGSGKTTLLRLFNCTVEPTSGCVKVDGEWTTTESISAEEASILVNSVFWLAGR